MQRTSLVMVPALGGGGDYVRWDGDKARGYWDENASSEPLSVPERKKDEVPGLYLLFLCFCCCFWRRPRI
jgi:hypothetical protein